jgi:peptidoglycan/LPS O-acetylase OafA/YrhL
MLRAVAATLVLLYHLVATSAFGWLKADSWLAAPAKLIHATGFAGVDLFFVISGVVMAYSSFDWFGEPCEIGPFLKRRAARIYPLYWICTAVVIALASLIPGLASRDKLEAATVVKSLLLWPQDDYPIVAVGWTLTFEVYFYLIFAGLIALPRRMLPWTLALWAIAALALFAWFDRPEYRGSLSGNLRLPLIASPLTLEFISGCFIGWYAKRGATLGGSAAILAGSILFIGGSAVGMRYPQELHYGLERVAVFGCGSALIVYGCIALERTRKLRVPQAVKYCGDASYSLYLTHMYVLWGVARLWPAPLNGQSTAGPQLALTSIAIAACGAIAAASYFWLEQPLHRLSLRILGVARPVGPGRTSAA